MLEWEGQWVLMRVGPEMETRGEEMRARCKKSSKCQLIIAQIQYNIYVDKQQIHIM